MSVMTSVPATRLKAFDGRRTAREGRLWRPWLGGPGVEAVEGVAAGQDGDVAAGGGQADGLIDEVVVDAESAWVMCRVDQGEVAEWDVADRGYEGVGGHARGFEAFGTDLRVWVEGGGDGGGDGVVVDADHDSVFRGGQTDECSCPAARFEDAPIVQAGLTQCVPHGRCNQRVGVVGVEDAGLGGAVGIGGAHGLA